jgi:hypothetical protein
MISIDSYNIKNKKQESVCLICHDDIYSNQNYQLPECNHIYHTDCIIQWFRMGNSNCPYCNYSYNNEDNLRSYSSRRNKLEKDYTLIKKFSKEKKSPKILQTKINQIEKLKIQLVSFKEELNKMKNENGKYSDLKKKYISIRQKIYKKTNSIYNKKIDLVQMVNIVPIIIPVKKISKNAI